MMRSAVRGLMPRAVASSVYVWRSKSGGRASRNWRCWKVVLAVVVDDVVWAVSAFGRERKMWALWRRITEAVVIAL